MFYLNFFLFVSILSFIVFLGGYKLIDFISQILGYILHPSDNRQCIVTYTILLTIVVYLHSNITYLLVTITISTLLYLLIVLLPKAICNYQDIEKATPLLTIWLILLIIVGIVLAPIYMLMDMLGFFSDHKPYVYIPTQEDYDKVLSWNNGFTMYQPEITDGKLWVGSERYNKTLETLTFNYFVDYDYYAKFDTILNSSFFHPNPTICYKRYYEHLKAAEDEVKRMKSIKEPVDYSISQGYINSVIITYLGLLTIMPFLLPSTIIIGYYFIYLNNWNQ